MYEADTHFDLVKLWSHLLSHFLSPLSYACSLPQILMPANQNISAHNSHTAYAGHLLSLCLFEGCKCRFRSRSVLTKHHWTAHLPDAGGEPHSVISLPPEGSNEYRYSCTIEGCLHLFNMKDMLTQHSCQQHQSCPVPVTTPSSPLPSKPQTQVPPIEAHSPPMTPFSFQELNDEMSIDWSHHTTIMVISCQDLTISYPNDLTTLFLLDLVTHVTMAHIHILAAHALFVVTPLINLLWREIYQTVLNNHITWKLMVSLLEMILLHIIMNL